MMRRISVISGDIETWSISLNLSAISIILTKDFKSPLSALFKQHSAAGTLFGTSRVPCPSRTRMVFINRSRRGIALFFPPLGRPAGLPDRPFVKRVLWSLRSADIFCDLSIDLVDDRLCTPLLVDFLKGCVQALQSCRFSGVGLPSAYRSVDIFRIDLDSSSSSSSSFCSNNCAPASTKGIEYNVSAS